MNGKGSLLALGGCIALLALAGLSMPAGATGHMSITIDSFEDVSGDSGGAMVEATIGDSSLGAQSCSISWIGSDPVGEGVSASSTERFGPADGSCESGGTVKWTWPQEKIPQLEDAAVGVEVTVEDGSGNSASDTGEAAIDTVNPVLSDWQITVGSETWNTTDETELTNGVTVQNVAPLENTFTVDDGTATERRMMGTVDPSSNSCSGASPSDSTLVDGGRTQDTTTTLIYGDDETIQDGTLLCLFSVVEDRGGNTDQFPASDAVNLTFNDQPQPTHVGIGTPANPGQVSFSEPETDLSESQTYSPAVNIDDTVGIRLKTDDSDNRDHYIEYSWETSTSACGSASLQKDDSTVVSLGGSDDIRSSTHQVPDSSAGDILCFRGVTADADGGVTKTALFRVDVAADVPFAQFSHSNGGDGQPDYVGQNLPAFLKTQNTVTICPASASEDCHIQIHNFPSADNPTVSLYTGPWCTEFGSGEEAQPLPPDDPECDTEAPNLQVKSPDGGTTQASSEPWKLEWSMADTEIGVYRLFIEIDTGEIRNITVSRVAVGPTGNDGFTSGSNGITFNENHVGLEASTGVQTIQEGADLQPFANYSGGPGVHTVTYRLTEGTSGTGCDDTTEKRYWETTREATPSNDGVRNGVDLWPQEPAGSTNATFPSVSPEQFTSDQFSPSTPPEGQYALSLCLSDAFDRPPAQTNVTFGGTDGWAIIVDETRPTANLDNPPEAIEPQRFTIRAEIQDDPIPANTQESDDEYDAIPTDLNRRFRLLTQSGEPIKLDADVGSPQFEWPMKLIEPNDPGTGDVGTVVFGGSVDTVSGDHPDCDSERCLIVDTDGDLDTDSDRDFRSLASVEKVQPWVKVTDPAENENLNPALGQSVPLVEFDPHLQHTGNNPELVTSLPCGGDGETACKAFDDRTPQNDGSYVQFNHSLRLVNPAQAEDEVEIRWFNTGGSEWPIEVSAEGETFTQSPAVVNISAAPGSQTPQKLPVEVRIQPPDGAEGGDFSEWKFETESQASSRNNHFNNFTVQAELDENREFDSELTLEGIEGWDGNTTLEPGNNTTGEFRIDNDGNTPATFTLDYGDDQSNDDCERTQDDSVDDQVLLRLLDGETERTQVSLDKGEEATLTLKAEAERLAPPDRTFDCLIDVANTQTSREHTVSIDVLRDSALEMYERQDPAEPEDTQTKKIERTGRPGETVATQITYENKGNDDLDIRLKLKPTIAGWDWTNRDSARTFTVASFSGSDQTPSQISERCDGDDEACYVPVNITVPQDAVRGESATFTLTAINQATNTAINSVDVTIEVDDPGDVDIHQPATQVIPEPSSGSTTTSFGFSATPTLPFKGETTGKLKVVAGCEGTPTLEDIEPTTEEDKRATFNFDVSFSKSGSWTIEVPNADTEGDSPSSVFCTLKDGADRGIVYLRPGVSTTTDRVDFFGEKVIAVALGYEKTADLAEATLEKPSDQVYRAEQGDPIEFSVSGDAFDARVPDNRAGFLVHQGQAEDGFHHIGCLTSASCDFVQEYKSVDVLERPVDGGIPISAEEFTADRVHTTENEADSDVPEVDGFVDEVRLGDGTLDAGHEPVVFHVVGEDDQEADEQTTVDVEVTLYDNFGETHELPTVKAKNLGGGWFEADLVLPVVQQVTRGEIELRVNGDTVAGNSLSGDAKIRFGASNTPYELNAGLSNSAVYAVTEDGETTWYLDANGDGQIDELDWTLASTDNDGGRTPNDLVSQAELSGQDWAVGVVRDQPKEGIDTYYLDCTSCNEETRIRLTPYGNEVSRTWTLVDDGDADSGLSLTTASIGLEGAVVGNQGPQLYVDDGAEQHLVRLTQTDRNFREYSTVDVEDPPVTEFWTPPENSDLSQTVLGDAAQQVIAPSDTYANGLRNGDRLHLAFASPNGAVGEGITPIRIGALSVSTTDLEGTNRLRYDTISRLTAEPHVPDRAPRATGHQPIDLTQDGSSPWMVGEARFDAQASLERTWAISVPTDTDDIEHTFEVSRALDSPQQDTRLPAFVALTEDNTLQGRTFDHRAVPGFDLHASNVTFDLVAVNESAAELQRRSEVTNIQVVDPNPPDVSIGATDAIEQGIPLEVTVSAIDVSGVDEVTATWSLEGEDSENEIELTRQKGTSSWNGTFAPDEQGTITITATAVDPGGNEGTATHSVSVLADEEPRVRFQGPVNDGTAFVSPGSQATFEVEDATIPDGEITVSEQGADAPSENLSTLTGAEGQLELEGLGDTLSTGSYTVTVTATNNSSEPLQDGLVWLNASADGVSSTIDANETDADGKVTGRVDLTATGTHTLTLEANNASLDDALSASFDVQVFDPDQSGDSVDASIDCGTTTCDVTFDPGLSSHGDSATVQIKATDGTGSTNTSVFSIQADGQAPTAAINVDPGSGSDPIEVGGDSTITVDANDPSGIADIQLASTQGGRTLAEVSVLNESGEITIRNMGIQDGEATLQATVRDQLGAETTESVDVSVDGSGPDIGDLSLAATDAGCEAQIAISDPSGVADVSLSYDGGSGTVDTSMASGSGGYATVLQQLRSDIDTVSYTVEATDELGNTATAQGSVSASPCVEGAVGVSITSPADGDTVSGQVDLSLQLDGPSGGTVTVDALTIQHAEGTTEVGPDVVGTDFEVPTEETTTVDTRSLPNGQATISVEAGTNDTTVSDSITVTIDNAEDTGCAETVDLDETDDASVDAVGDGLLCIQADPVEGATHVRIQVVGDGQMLVNETRQANEDGVYKLPTLADGDYDITVTQLEETEDGVQQELDTASAGVSLAPPKPFGQFVATLVLGAAVLATTAYAAFGRWS